MLAHFARLLIITFLRGLKSICLSVSGTDRICIGEEGWGVGGGWGVVKYGDCAPHCGKLLLYYW